MGFFLPNSTGERRDFWTINSIIQQLHPELYPSCKGSSSISKLTVRFRHRPRNFVPQRQYQKKNRWVNMYPRSWTHLTVFVVTKAAARNHVGTNFGASFSFIAQVKNNQQKINVLYQNSRKCHFKAPRYQCSCSSHGSRPWHTLAPNPGRIWKQEMGNSAAWESHGVAMFGETESWQREKKHLKTLCNLRCCKMCDSPSW